MAVAPYRVELEADPDTLCADGVSTAILTAIVTDGCGKRVQDGTVVTFATSLGSVSSVPGGIPGSILLPLPTSESVITALLTAGEEPELAVVTATTGEQIRMAEVQFVSCLYLPLVLRHHVHKSGPPPHGLVERFRLGRSAKFISRALEQHPGCVRAITASAYPRP